jgi:hypothetical protein
LFRAQNAYFYPITTKELIQFLSGLLFFCTQNSRKVSFL